MQLPLLRRMRPTRIRLYGGGLVWEGAAAAAPGGWTTTTTRRNLPPRAFTTTVLFRGSRRRRMMIRTSSTNSHSPRVVVFLQATTTTTTTTTKPNCYYDDDLAFQHHAANKRLWLRGFATTRKDDKEDTTSLDEKTKQQQQEQQQNDNEQHQEPPPSLWVQLTSSPPNIITATRMVSTPLLAYWVATEQYWWAIGGCTLAAISDYLDGYLAKKYGWNTVLGTYLDPLADKAFTNTLGVGLWYSGVLPTPLVLLWATKDVMLLSGTAWMLYQKHGSVSILTNSVAQEPLQVTPSTIAKVNTTLQFGTLVVGLMSPVLPVPPLVLEGMIWTTGGTTIATVASYGIQAGIDAKNRR